MRSITTFFMLLALFALSGCATDQPPSLYKTLLIAPDDSMLIDCDIEPPPDKATYLAGTDKDREKMLAKTLGKQYSNGQVCNDRWAKVRLWKKEQAQMIKDKEEKAKKGGK